MFFFSSSLQQKRLEQIQMLTQVERNQQERVHVYPRRSDRSNDMNMLGQNQCTDTLTLVHMSH